MSARTKKLATIAMLCAIAYVVMLVGRIPFIPTVMFLKYDPKDVIITIGGFIMGPLAAVTISVVVSLIEMVTVSDTGPIGLLMNVLSTCAFAYTASLIYKRRHSMSGAVTGLLAGVIMMTVTMMLWNYIVTPFYMNISREKVAGMLIPLFLPFNLVKAGINMAITMLLYKPIVSALRRTHLLETGSEGKRRINIGFILVALVLLCTCALLFLVLAGKI